MIGCDERAGRTDLVVVAVTWNSRDHLPEFVRGLVGGLSATASWTLVVADNDSADGTAELVASLPAPANGTIRLVRTGANRGYSGGINAALATITDDVPVLIVNPDVRFEPGAVTALLQAVRAGVGIAVPVQVDAAGRPLPTLRREPTLARAWGEALLGGRTAGRWHRWGELVLDPEAYTSQTQADWASGSVLLVSPDCRRAVEPWDERYFLYSEETDFALRARDRGFATVLVPDARCQHLQGQSHTSPRLWQLLTVNRVRLFGIRHGPVRTLGFRAALIVGSGIRSVGRGGATHRAALRALLSPARRWPELIRALSG